LIIVYLISHLTYRDELTTKREDIEVIAREKSKGEGELHTYALSVRDHLVRMRRDVLYDEFGEAGLEAIDGWDANHMDELPIIREVLDANDVTRDNEGFLISGGALIAFAGYPDAWNYRIDIEHWKKNDENLRECMDRFEMFSSQDGSSRESDKSYGADDSSEEMRDDWNVSPVTMNWKSKRSEKVPANKRFFMNEGSPVASPTVNFRLATPGDTPVKLRGTPPSWLRCRWQGNQAFFFYSIKFLILFPKVLCL